MNKSIKTANKNTLNEAVSNDIDPTIHRLGAEYKIAIKD